MKFEINKTEEAKMKRWTTSHSKKCLLLPNQSYSIIFTPIGVGDKISVQCSRCNTKKDITDYSNF
jgi:hypothetical protein